MFGLEGRSGVGVGSTDLNNPSVGIESCSEEVVLEIFTKFADCREGQNVPLVCRQWFRISQELAFRRNEFKFFQRLPSETLDNNLPSDNQGICLQKYPNVIILAANRNAGVVCSDAQVICSNPPNTVKFPFIQRIEVIGDRMLTLSPTHFRTYSFYPIKSIISQAIELAPTLCTPQEDEFAYMDDSMTFVDKSTVYGYLKQGKRVEFPSLPFASKNCTQLTFQKDFMAVIHRMPREAPRKASSAKIRISRPQKEAKMFSSQQLDLPRPNGSIKVESSDDKRLHVYSTQSKDEIYSKSLSADVSHLASNSNFIGLGGQKSIVILDAKTGKEIGSLPLQDSDLTEGSFQLKHIMFQDHYLMAEIYQPEKKETTLILWDILSSEQMSKIVIPGDIVSQAWHKRSLLTISSERRDCLQIWDSFTGKKIDEKEFKEENLCSVAYKKEKYALVATDKKIYHWSLQNP